jgi:type I restriction enzyme S subunit
MRKNNYQYKKTVKTDWLSQIPVHWFEVRLGSLFNERKTKVSDVDYPPLSVTKNGIVPQLENAAKSNDGDNRKLVLSGDFVINSRSDRKGSSGLSRLNGSVSLINIVLRPIQDIDPKFSEYLLKSYFFKEEYYRYGRGIVEDLWTTRYSEMKNMIIPKPPYEEQTAIANFLKYKISKIDRFIRKKKQLIKLLNEQKAAIINQAVTRGLDPNARMKPSGIEWLGGIPEHWEVRKLKGITKIISKGTTPNTLGRNLLPSGDVIFLKAENIGMNNIVSFDPKNYIDNETNNLLGRSKLEENDILFVIAGATIGKVAILDNQFIPANTNQAVSFIRLKNTETVKFVWYWLQSEFIKQQMWLEAVTSAQPNLAMGKLRNFPVLLPNKKEQCNIVEYIEKETSLLNQTISTIEKEILLTQEYKTALIAEAVIGKIDVRDFVVPEVSEEESFEELEEELNLVADDESEYQNEDLEE